MDLKNIHTSKTIRRIIIGLGIAILILGIFKLGMIAGAHKARFGDRFGDNFTKNFVDPRHGKFGRDFGDRDLPPGGHGAIGEIISITLPQIVVAGPDNLEKIVVVATTTRIREFQNEMQVTDLKIGDSVVVLGTPNDDGQVEAKLIRIVPTQENNLESSTKIQ